MRHLHRTSTRDQKTTVVYGVICFLVVLVVVQLWLFTATLNAYLGGDTAVVWPGLGGSVVCFLLAVGLLRYLRRM